MALSWLWPTTLPPRSPIPRVSCSSRGRKCRWRGGFGTTRRLSLKEEESRGSPLAIFLDNSSGLRTGVSSETLAGLSFISFVYPHEKWSLTVYRHQSANFEAPTETQGLFSDPIPLNDLIFRVSAQQVGETLRIGAFRTFTDIEISTYGVAGAYSLTETFSLGGGFLISMGLSPAQPQSSPLSTRLYPMAHSAGTSMPKKHGSPRPRRPPLTTPTGVLRGGSCGTLPDNGASEDPTAKA